jgi:deoxyribonuclease IV
MENNIRLGPAGIGNVKEVEETFAFYREKKIRAAEIPFTYGIFIKRDEDIERVRRAAGKNNILLSIHAPYWINLNSKEKEKIEKSKERILNCCKIGEKLGAYRVVFHAGYFGDRDKEVTYQNIKRAVLEMQEEIKSNKWKIRLAPETMGKINVFGSVEEIARLKNETKCGFCIDFAHILARDKKVDFEKLKKLFPEKQWHCHFSGIEYGEKGEKKHIKTEENKWRELLENIPKDKEIIIINEAPDTVGDSIEGIKILGH